MISLVSHLIWGLFFLLSLLLRALPMPLFLLKGYVLGRLIQMVGFRRKIILQNVTRAYPEWTEPERKAFLKKHYTHLGTLALELIRDLSQTSKSVSTAVDVTRMEETKQRLKNRQPVMLLSAHFSHWELGMKALATEMPVAVTLKKIKGGVSQVITEKQRTRFGVQPVYPNSDVSGIKTLIEALATKAVVFVLDQYQPNGLPVNFFGVPAQTSTGLWKLASHTRIPMYVLFATRDKNGRCHLTVSDAIPFFQNEDRELEKFLNTQAYTYALETGVRLCPEQWLWIHRRWKNPHHEIPEAYLKAFEEVKPQIDRALEPLRLITESE